MKRNKAKYLMYISAGILVMNSGTIFNYFFTVNDHLTDFLKGLGTAWVLAVFFRAVRNQNCRQPEHG